MDINMDDWKMVDSTCATCNIKTEVLNYLHKNHPESVRCDDCLKKYEQEQEVDSEIEKMQGKNEEWKVICPPLYRETKIAHEQFPLAKWKELSKREFSERSLILTGKTGTGKTRLMFEYLKKLYFTKNVIPTIIWVGDLSLHVLDSLKDTKAYSKLEDSWKTCSLLFIDDIFAEKCSDRVEDVLFRIIDTRTRNMLPIFATTQREGESVIEMFQNKERAKAIVRRLREFSDGIRI